MTLPTFVKPHHNYGSYDDYWRLVEVSGFPVCMDSEVEWNSKNTYIFTYFSFPLNAEMEWPELPKHACYTVMWDIERWCEGKTIHPGVDEFWVSDKWYQSKLPGSEFVILGTTGVDDLALSKLYTFSTRDYRTDRRKRIIAEFEKMGSKFAPNTMERKHKELLQSEVMLCMHQDTLPMTEPLRYALAASYNLPILAEYSQDFYPFEKGMEVILEGDYRFYWLKYPTVNYGFKFNILQALGLEEYGKD